jgi:cytochrome d ubiquinol oxidase subunit I
LVYTKLEGPMSALDLARWQFAITTVYHFLFVPLTIGLGFLVAGLQTAWVRTDRPEYLRATKFFGKLFLINFAMGVVTGIVQEFQFGMNWSTYSRFVGDIFGAPLAIEGLLAFFLESTFLGVWIFGWDRVSKRVHLATIWVAATGTLLSAYFIIAANSFMQHPVGYSVNPTTGRAELNSIFALLTNSTTLAAFPHTISAAFLTTGAFMLGVSAIFLAKARETELFRRTFKVGGVAVVVGTFALVLSGHIDGQIMTKQQPMKMAAAEAIYDTQTNAGFSLFTIGSVNGLTEKSSLRIPGVASILATNSPGGKVEGINDLQAQYEKTYGPGNYVPYVPVTYWSFRFMMGFGFLSCLLGLLALWRLRGGRTPGKNWLMSATVLGLFFPLAGNSFGWIFTELGRQPWIVFGQMQTSAGVSPTVSALNVWISMIVMTLLYGALAVVEVGLLRRAIKVGPAPAEDDPYGAHDDADRPLTMAY